MRVFAQCPDLVKAEENGLLSRNGSTRGSAVIFGEAVTVPELRLRFVDAKTGTSIAPRQVIVTYPWKWLEYPYPEHPWGAWSDAYDFLKCAPRENAGEVDIPEFKLVPRGGTRGSTPISHSRASQSPMELGSRSKKISVRLGSASRNLI